jgi:RimJ/RimL family protein N-acetyltransferase
VLRGEKVYLRARADSDVAELYRELYEDVDGFSRADGRAWRPHPVGPESPYTPKPPSQEVAAFSAVSVAGDTLLGDALLWSIDLHNRYAHVGISLLPAARGRGFSVEVLHLLSRYGFDTLGLHRLQLETLADNAAMIAAATRAGYRLEGTLRDSAWVTGAFVDEVVMGQTADEWRSRAG